MEDKTQKYPINQIGSLFVIGLADLKSSKSFSVKVNPGNLSVDDLTEDQQKTSEMLNSLSSVCSADKYPDFVSVYWRVDPQGTKLDYFKQFMKFCNSTKWFFPCAEENNSYKTGLQVIAGGAKSHLCLEDIMVGGFDAHPRFADFQTLCLNLVYGTVTMEDISGTPWKPETGMMTVRSELNLAQPLSTLIYATAKVNGGDVKDVESALKKIYAFPPCYELSQPKPFLSS